MNDSANSGSLLLIGTLVLTLAIVSETFGSDGESTPTAYNPVRGKISQDGSGPTAEAPAGVYTFSHTAGYGLIYLVTGDQNYGDLGRRCMEKALEEYRDRDNRYAFRHPYGALRAGPSLGWTAVGYDLCYNGWDEEFREKVARAIFNYNEGKNMSLGELVRGSRHMPASNHWGMQVGGGALAVLAIMNDQGTEPETINSLLRESEKAMIRNLAEGFGDHGWFLHVSQSLARWERHRHVNPDQEHTRLDQGKHEG